MWKGWGMKTFFITSLLVLGCLLASAPAATAQDRADMKSCGDLAAADGLLIGDVLARNVTCSTAKKVARRLPGKCDPGGSKASGSCSVRGFSCLFARAAPELRFARCSKPSDDDELFKTIRFDYGS
jgi:hypothetical protein